MHPRRTRTTADRPQPSRTTWRRTGDRDENPRPSDRTRRLRRPRTTGRSGRVARDCTAAVSAGASAAAVVAAAGRARPRTTSPRRDYRTDGAVAAAASTRRRTTAAAGAGAAGACRAAIRTTEASWPRGNRRSCTAAVPLCRRRRIRSSAADRTAVRHSRPRCPAG